MPFSGVSNVSYVLVISRRAQCAHQYNFVAWIVNTIPCGAIGVARFEKAPWVSNIELKNARLSLVCLPGGIMWRSLPFVRNIAVAVLFLPLLQTGFFALLTNFCSSLHPRFLLRAADARLMKDIVILQMSSPGLNSWCWPSGHSTHCQREIS